MPLYTSYLTPNDYGAVELVFTTTQFFTPIITLQVTHATYRFLFEAKEQKEQSEIITNSALIIGIGSLLLVLFSLPLAYYKQSIFFLYGSLYISTNAISQCIQQSLRGIKRNTLFALLGIFSTLIQISCNIIFIVGLGMRSQSLLIAPILANGIIIIFSLLYKQFYRNYSIKYINCSVLKSLVRFSAPLIPDAFIWWFLSGFSRFYISNIQGASQLGIYAIANKFSDLIIVVYAIFHMAWTENAYTTYNDNDRDEYFSTIFNMIMKLIVSAMIIGLPLTRIAIIYMLGDSFQSAYQYIPILYLTVTFNLLATFYGTGFQCAKKTGGTILSSCISGFVNVLCNLLLVSSLGIWGTVIAMLCANIALFITRAVQSVKFFHIDIKKSNYFLIIPLLLTGFIYYSDQVFLLMITVLLGGVVFIKANYSLLKNVVVLISQSGRRFNKNV